MSLAFFAVKTIVRLLARSQRKRFLEALEAPEEAQKALLNEILQGSLIPFPQMPLSYEDFKDRPLTVEKVLFFETTSGSTGAKKNIPYTKGLLRSFERMFILWADDLLNHSDLNLKSGRFFISVSPQIGTSTDDRKYLSFLTSALLSPFLVSNPNTHKAARGEDFLFKVSLELVKAKDLEVISIWSPTYLLSLLDYMRRYETVLGIRGKSWREIWPELKLISCWAEAQAEKGAGKIRSLFPEVKVQPKGLLSTEAPATIPWTDAGGALPLLTETYFEFERESKLCKLHEVECGKEYVLVISQRNGFLRYRTGDRVRVESFHKKVPVLRFLGRTGESVDLAGEKFSEELLSAHFTDLRESFLIVPDNREDLPGYVIYGSTAVPWESRLREIYHYKLARELGQLRAPKIVPTINPAGLYMKFQQKRGMNLGDIKERVLISDLSLAKKFLEETEKVSPSSH